MKKPDFSSQMTREFSPDWALLIRIIKQAKDDYVEGEHNKCGDMLDAGEFFFDKENMWLERLLNRFGIDWEEQINADYLRRLVKECKNGSNPCKKPRKVSAEV